MRKITKANLYNKFLVALICFMGVSLNSFGQCPTVTTPLQSFCDIDVPKVTDLVATDNGGGIRWYASATSTTPLSNTVGLVNGRDYYADDNSGTCGTRQRVDVEIYGVPFGLGFQGVCVDHPEEATIADLYAVGNDLQWYSVDSGGSPLDPTTILVDSTIYYVDQANPNTGCRTSRLSVYVNVGLVPVPTGDAIQIFCGDTQATVADLVASGNNNWYSTTSSRSPLALSTPLVNGQSYYATTIDPPCESTERLQVTVEIIAPNNPGGNGEMEICESGLASTNTVNLFDALLGGPDTNGTWSGPLSTSNGNIGTVNVTSMTSAGSPYIFTYEVSSEYCPSNTATVSIFIIEAPNPGTNGSLILCSNGASQDLFDSLGGTPEPGGIWSPALASGTGIFNPAQDAAGIYTYTVQGVPPCGDVSATVEVTVNPEANPGSNGNLTLCYDSTPTNLFNSLGGSPQAGGTWTPALASGTGIFDPAQDAEGIYTYSVSGISPCGIATATVTVSIVPPPNPGTNGSLILCSNDASTNLFERLGGTPETGGVWSPALSSGTGVFDPSLDAAGIYTYTIQGLAPCGPVSATVDVTVNPKSEPGTNGSLTLCFDSAPENLFNSLGGSPQTGGTWSPALASGTGVFNPALDAAGIYTYTVSGISPCGDATSTVTVTINPLANAGSNASLILCSHEAALDLFESLGGTPETGGIWSPALTSGTGVFDPAQDASGIYTYTVQGIAPCGDATATVNVTVNPGSEPGINGNLTVCVDSAPEDLFNSLGGTPQTGGTWSPALASGTGVFNPAQDAAGIYSYTIAGISPCGDATSTVTVTVNPLANAGSNASLILCSHEAPQDLFDILGGTPETGGIWSPALASGTGVFDPALDAAGIYTYTVQGIAPCGDATATVNVTVNPGSEPGINGSLTVCVDSAPEDLFNSLGGTPQTGGTWSPALASGTGVFNPLQDAAGIYTYTIAGISPCGDATSTVTVTVNPLPNAGSNSSLILCSHDAAQDLFNSLGGSPDAGGVWSPALVSGTGVFDPALDAAGIYTYTVQGIAPCGQASSTVEVTVNPGVEPGTNGNITLCMNSTPEDLFNSLGGTPQTGGTWSPALASGTGVFDPTKDAEGIYTYTIVGISPCGDATATVTVTISELSDAGTNGSLILCVTDTSQDLFDSLGGTPKTGGVWSPALASGTGVFDPALDAAGVYKYTVQGTPPCGEASATVEVTLNPEADPGIDGTLLICIESAPEDLFNSLGGSPESGGTWTPALASGTGVFDPSQDAVGTYTYTVTGTSPCGVASSTVTVTIDPLPEAGSDGRLAICTNDAPEDLFERLGGTPDLGGTWSPALASSSGFFDPAQDSAGSYTYSVTTACGTDSATVVVALIPQPDITGLTLSADTICLEDAIDVNLSGASQLSDGNYSLTYSLSGANSTEQTITVTISNGSTVINVPASELTSVGTTTFTILNLLNPVTNCGTASGTLPTVDFNIEQAPTPQLITDGDFFCIDDAPTIADLTSNLIGADTIIWYDAVENGNPYPEDTPLTDGATYYASNSTTNGCSTGIRLAVTVSIESCEPLEIIIPDGFSPNGDNINDDFLIKNLRELYPNFQLQIYNRYGNILYKGDANTPNWDGRSTQGREVGSGILPVGVYFYILELKDTNNKTIQGRVYLSR
ncbi:gliding motility-associated C-terminal domain-containing protein [Gelidibacter gilvus]|uniref:Gliding motility-associated C-terminal domain-containing protein n=1 Tax=Gelidibacter gilvus TaxID=59602 RepID=A0A4Q0XJ10_9FLAO|nr:gliding motility-associated C-terminal domain-containing protein [Gelidibacter gilvus]RXJ50178.1 gliding motility-associated C-terminal domain-containing protein [Gelidibacter gilvus]